MLRFGLHWQRFITVVGLFCMLFVGTVPMSSMSVIRAEENVPTDDPEFFFFTLDSLGWHGTNFHPGPGTRVQVRHTTGLWSLGGDNPYTNANGVEGKRSNCALAPNANAGGLVAKFGVRTPFFVGNDMIFDVDNSDELIFSINDCPEWMNDNKGNIQIQVITYRPTKTLQGNVYLNDVPVWTGFQMVATNKTTGAVKTANVTDQYGFYKFEGSSALPVGQYTLSNYFSDPNCSQNAPLTIQIPTPGDIAPDIRIRCQLQPAVLHEPKEGNEIQWDTDVTLSWDQVQYATQYAVEIAGPGLPVDGLRSGRISETSFHVGKLQKGEYRWKVEAYRGNSNTGFKLTTFKVKEAPQKPEIPVLIWPKDGAEIQKGTDVTLDWQDAPRAEEYTAELWSDTLPGGMIKLERTALTSFHVGELAKGEYRWKVQAYNQIGHSDWVETTFKVIFKSYKYTIVFVPGFQGIGRKKQMTCDQGLQKVTTYDDNDPAKPQLLEWLSEEYEVYTTHWTSGPDRSDKLEKAGECIGAQLQELKSKTPSDQPIVLICHSMGCLLARYYLESGKFPNANDGTPIVKLISLGSPHLGIPRRAWNMCRQLFLYGIAKESSCDFNQQPSFAEVMGGVRLLDGTVRAPGIQYFLISGDSNSFWGLLARATVKFQKSDFLVGTESGLGLVGAEQRITTDEDHISNSIIDNSYLSASISRGRSQSYGHIQNILNGTMSVSSSNLYSVTSEIDEEPNLAEVSTALNFQSRSTDAQVFELDTSTGKGLVILEGLNTTRAFVVVSPSEIIKYSSVDGPLDDDVSYQESDTSGMILINSEEPGKWYVSVAAIDPSITELQIYAQFENPVYAKFEYSEPVLGESVTITPTVYGVEEGKYLVWAVKIEGPDGTGDVVTDKPFKYKPDRLGFYYTEAIIIVTTDPDPNTGHLRFVRDFFEVKEEDANQIYSLYLPLITR